MCRRPLLFACALVLLLSPTSTRADVAPPVDIRWLGERVPARTGQELAGHFEIVTGTIAGQVENVRIEGNGWRQVSIDAPGRTFLPPRTHRAVAFRAVPQDPNELLVIRGTFNGAPFEQYFSLDEARLARIGRSGTVRSRHAPVLSPVNPTTRDGRSSATQTGSVHLHFTGRFTYTRSDNVVMGGDYIVVRFMDQDLISDEEIGRTVTDYNGNFDASFDWDDCDISGCDAPDIYVIYETASDPVVVRTYDDQETYSWRTNVIDDFPGGTIDFGEQSPDNGQDAVVHVYTDLIRARRYGIDHGAMTPPQVLCNFPDPGNGAFYKMGGLNEINISTAEEWVEGTHIHEFGHHLEQYFNVIGAPNYIGLCAPNHCIWCPNDAPTAWQEGWPNWFGSRVDRQWKSLYGVDPTSINDFRYTLETPTACQVDGIFYPGAATEGYVGGLLRDIDDDENDDHDGGAFDCDIDAMSLGDAEIFTVFRDDDASSITDFVQKFRTRYPQYNQDFWSTVRNVDTDWSFPLPAPQATTVLPPCRLVRDGETLTFDMTGNGSLVGFRWRQNGTLLSDNFYVHGSQTRTLSIFPFRSEYAGTYDCVILSCDGTQSGTSSSCRVMPDASPAERTLVSWGENSGGQIGDGTSGGQRSAYPYARIYNAVAADGGRSFAIALRADGQLMSWGSEQWGELGDGVMNGQRTTPGPVKGRITTQATPQPLTDVDQIVAGKYFGLALKRDGSLWTWGNNTFGQLATGSTLDMVYASPSQYSGCIRAIAAGESHSVVVMADGTVWTSGYNGSFGTLGTGSFGGYSTTPVQVAGLTNVVDVEAGDYFTLALKADGTVWAWGYNTWGTLGCGNFTSSAVPVQVTGLTNVASIGAGSRNGWAVTSSHACYGWGENAEVGNGVGTGLSSTPQHITALDGLGVQRIDGSNGFLYALALLANGKFKVWGTNHGASSTQVGIFNTVSPPNSSTVPLDVPTVQGATGFGLSNGPTAYVLGTAAVTDAEEPPVAAITLALSARPNPSRGPASIAYDLPSDGPVSIGIYDVGGRAVRRLVDGNRPAGRHSIAWDGRGDSGAPTAPGVYFVRLEAAGSTLRRTLVRFE